MERGPLVLAVPCCHGKDFRPRFFHPIQGLSWACPYIGAICGIMEKRMETTIMGYIGIIGDILG